MYKNVAIADRNPNLLAVVGLVTCLLMGLLLTDRLVAQQPTAASAVGFRAYNLQHVDAATAAAQLQNGIEPGSAEVYIDASRNQIIVKGDELAQRTAAQLIGTIDRPTARPVPATQNQVQGYSVAAGQLEAIATDLVRRFPATTGVRIIPDPRTNQVVVIGPAAIHQQVSQLLQKNTPAPAPRNPIATSPPASNEMMLQKLNWRQFEAALRSMLGNRVRISSDMNGLIATIELPAAQGSPRQMQLDRRTGRLVVSGDDEITQAWLRVARILDAPQAGGEAQTQMVPAQRADPALVKDAVSKVRQAEKAAGDTAITVPSANPRNGPRWGGDLVSTIFAQQPAEGQPAPSEPTPAVDLGAENEPVGLVGSVELVFIPELNIYVLRGQKEDVEKVIALIEQIENQTYENQPTILIHPLKHVNSVVLSDLIAGLYDDVFGTRLSPVTITPLDKPNSLLLIGREESMESILDLIEKLDQPVPPATQLKVFPLQYMSAVDAETQVRDFFTDDPGGGEDNRPGLGTRVRVLADYRTNSLIVHAGPRDMAEISLLIKKLDIDEAAAENQLRVFRLEHALADDLQAVLQEAITGVAPGAPDGAGGGAGTNAQATPVSSRLTIVTLDQDGNRIINSGIPGAVSVTADPNVNALLVRAPAKSMELIEELIKQLDQLPNAEAQIKVFHLENGDATSLTVLLQELFGLQVTAGQSAGTNAFNTALTAGAGGESSLVPIRFTNDLRTNSIIASGSKTDLEVVEVLLLRLDESDVESRRTEVIRLKNAPAADVALAITTFLQTQRQLVLQQLQLSQLVSPFEQIDREVIVVAEPVTNSLIVSATPRYFDEILTVIEDLDYRLKMVMVQVVIAEVELNDASESGVEFGMQDSLLADRGLVLGNSITQDQIAVGEVLAATATSALGVGRSSATFGYGGIVLSAANESINVIIRALQDEGRLQILSRPQIMTLDNVEAFVQVGARVPRLTGTTITNTGQVNNTEDVDVGLLLTVRPRVSPDGLIIMEVGAEKSEVGNPEDGIPVAITNDGPVLSPQINTTTAQTVISAHSGQTVVFAGLITKSKLNSRRAVPYLGEMPYIGPLFRYDVESEKRTELLIILTPYILEGDEDIDQLKHLESDRMSWCLSDLLEMHGDVGLSPGRGLWGGDDHTSTIFPDLNPTGSINKPEGKTARSMVDVLPGNKQDPTTAKRSAARPVRLPQVPRQRAVVNPPPEIPAVQPTSYYPTPNYNP